MTASYIPLAGRAESLLRRLPSRTRISACAAVGLAAAAAGVFAYKHPLWIVDRAIRARLKLAGFSSRYISVGPYRAHYFVGGRGRPLLLIHGLGSRSEDWAPQMGAYTSNGFRVYAIDLLGCGKTDRPDIAYTIEEQTELIQGFLDALGIEQADVVGWSMGGWVALEFALRHPRRVRRLVVMDSAGMSFETSLTPEIFPPRTIPEWRRMQTLFEPNPRPMPAFVERDLLRVMAKDAAVVRRTAHTLLSGRDQLDGRLGSIEAPVLIVWGEQDALVPLSAGLRMHEAIPHSVMEIYSGCGHVAPANCAPRIAPRVLDFLLREPPPSNRIERY